MKSLLLLIGLVPAFAAANECNFTEQHDFDIDLAGLKTVAFVLNSSDIEVEGADGLKKVEVRGRACASENAKLAEIGVEQQRNGDRVTITTRQARNNSTGWFGSNYAYVDLRVRVPRGMAIDIHGSSGDADVRDVATLNVETSSGDLNVQKIAGVLTFEVSSGDVQGSDIGSVDVRRTSSGDVELRDIIGDVKVARSGSGDLQFDKVGGSVTIGSVGSGDVSVSRVMHDVSVDSIGSGDVNVSDVSGNLTVRSKGSGDVHHRDVRGSVSVPRDND